MADILKFPKEKICPEEIIKLLQEEIDKGLIADLYVVTIGLDHSSKTHMTGDLNTACFASTVLQTHIQNILNGDFQ